MELDAYSQNGFRGWKHKDLVLPAEIIHEPVSAKSLQETELLLDCEGRLIFRIPFQLGDQRVSCFLYSFRNSSLQRSFRTHYALHILGMAQKLRRHGFKTLEVLAALAPKRQFLNWDSLLVAREITSVQELPSAGKHIFQVHPWTLFTDEIAGIVGREIARFHSLGFVHGDLKTRHILARISSGNGSAPEMILVDLEKTRELRVVPRPIADLLAARDLVQLLTSLPSEQDGQNVNGAKQHLLESYFSARELPKRRMQRITRILDMYGPGGSLVQGQTVLGALLSRKRGG